MRPKGRPHVIAPDERMSSAYAQRQEPKVPRNILLRPLNLPPMVPIKDQPEREFAKGGRVEGGDDVPAMLDNGAILPRDGFTRLLEAVGGVDPGEPDDE